MPLEDILVTVWEGIPKLNPLIPGVEKVNPWLKWWLFLLWNQVNPPVGVQVPQKLNLFMTPNLKWEQERNGRKKV